MDAGVWGMPLLVLLVLLGFGIKGPNNEFHLYREQNGTIMVHIPDPWDNRWVQGEMIALYGGGTASKPLAHIMISRELTLPVPTQKEVTTKVLQSEQAIQKSLHQPSTPPNLAPIIPGLIVAPKPHGGH
jgi:hypothetical protein